MSDCLYSNHSFLIIFVAVKTSIKMNFKYLLIAILLLSTTLVKAELPTLSERSKVVLFTCSPGDELYAGFGHSAIWVSDQSTGVDRLYNYGTFDFSTPNFYWKFLRGKLDYMLNVTSVRRFITEYKYRKIGVVGQTIELNQNEKQKIFSLLEENLLPENRFYKYDFYYDNCATRIRDIVIESVDGTIDFNAPDQSISFRQILLPYLETTPWTKFGINIVLGLTSDKIASPNEYQYMPDYMHQQFASATVSRNGIESKLVNSETVYLKSKLIFKYNLLTDPALLFGILFLVVGLITAYEFKTKKYQKWLDLVLNSIGVLAGLFLFFMWVGTDHSATNQNLNILWLFPAQALYLIALFFKYKTRKKLIQTSFVIMVLVSFAMHLWPQTTELSFLLLSLLFALRYLFYSRIVSKNG